MIDPRNVPKVEPDEMLARFIFFSRHIRNDETVRPEAFMPHPHTDLSVTRERDATEAEIWATGLAIGHVREKKLHGRADAQGVTYVEQNLKLLADPVIGDPVLPDNPNHANVIGWSDDKARQKLSAIEIASQARLIRLPGTT